LNDTLDLRGGFIKTITLRLEDELHKQLKLTTVAEDTTMQDYVIKLIKKSLENTSM
jgi:predicted HicB family RNase H-like nuclease